MFTVQMFTEAQTFVQRTDGSLWFCSKARILTFARDVHLVLIAAPVAGLINDFMTCVPSILMSEYPDKHNQ